MKLYTFNHCPYCIKARMIFGLKKIPYQEITILNDDVETPTKLIGQKMVPILEKPDGSAIPESMDIVAFIDKNFGKPVILGKNNKAVSDWLEASRKYVSRLYMPRSIEVNLPEFATDSAIRYFKTKKEDMIGSFEGNISRTPELKSIAENHLEELVSLIKNESAVNGEEISEDDIHLFPTLRALTIVRGLAIPSKVLNYINNLSRNAEIELYFDKAI
ncbi:MAG: glutaredoxin 2 [Rickettsiales bacterium]|nr:glutaredoxin 2 [Rickettsiales bacterium]